MVNDRNYKYGEVLLIIFLSFYFFSYSTSNVAAHALSAGFTSLDIGPEKSELTYSIDALSVIEELGGDTNEDGILDVEELKTIETEVEEWIEDHIALDMNNQEQSGTMDKPYLETKGSRDLVTFHLIYPGFQEGQTVKLLDGLFTYGENSTAYTNFYQVTYDNQVNQGVLEGNNREWIMLLTPAQAQQEQATEGSTESIKPQTTQVSWTSFLVLGMKHILTGYDHLLFLFVLLLRKQSFKQYAALITAFTLAHSVTLTLAVLGIFDLPSKFVESAIAFSICYVALENIFKKEIKLRWLLTFFFGLIHGLGFASILKDMDISKGSLAYSLINFNVGIEIIQLLIVLALLPILSWLHRQKFDHKIITAGSMIILVLGVFWLFERLFL